MSMLEQGFEVVCPDGKVRHYPYHNQDDADCDARVFTRTCCRGGYASPTEMELEHGPCPEGEHIVRPIVFQPPPERGES